LGDGCLDALAIGHVAVREVGIAAGIGGFGSRARRRGLACPIVDVGDDDASAFFGETLSRCHADDPTAASDERHMRRPRYHSHIIHFSRRPRAYRSRA
jgi:hypothetical protein